jgi:hypothetical protein
VAKVDIVQNAIDLCRARGRVQPKVTILSAVETVTPKLRSSMDAAALAKMADRGQITGGMVDGPLAFDNAVSMAAARTKGIRSEVAGDADILVVPDLESGNMLAKQLEYLGDAQVAGIVLGATVPIVLTSRADSAHSRIASCAIALLWAKSRRGVVVQGHHGLLELSLLLPGPSRTTRLRGGPSALSDVLRIFQEDVVGVMPPDRSHPPSQWGRQIRDN